MRRLLVPLALALALALCAPQLARAQTCSNPQTYSSGSGSCTAPSGYNTVTIGAIGGGGDSSGPSVGSSGGGSCVITLSVTGGSTTIYYNVGTDGTPGSNSWANIASNAEPSSAAQGCYATGGYTSTGSGTYGTTYSGGARASSGGGGGGGAGTGGNGGAGSGGTGGTGGIGGALGVSGGAGGNYGSPGNAPGGGAGAGAIGILGAYGMVILSFSNVASCSGSPLTLHGVGSC